MRKRRLPQPSPPPARSSTLRPSLFTRNHVLSPLLLQACGGFGIASQHALHVLVDGVLVAVETFEGDDVASVRFRVAGEDFADAGPGDVLAVVDDYVKAACGEGGGGWGGECVVVSDADLSGGFCEDEIGYARVVHDEAS